MKIFNVEQLSPAWWELRRGIPTASDFSRIITPARGDLSDQADAYIAELIAERVGSLPHQPAWQPTADMIRGRDLEPEARAWYAFEYDIDVKQVGFVLSDCGRYGASPDGLIGDHGGLEIKCPSPKTHAQWLLKGGLPLAHKAQVHGNLAVTGRDTWVFVSYVEGFPQQLVVNVVRDAFTVKVETALAEFCDRLKAAADRLGISLDTDRVPATLSASRGEDADH